MGAIVEKWENSLAIRIPQNLAKEIHLAEGTQIDLSVIDGNLVIRPSSRERYALDELTKEITLENLHTEVDSGIAVGNEDW